MSSTLCDTCDKDSRYMAMKAENAKLRELCKDLLDGYECGYGRACDGCGYNGFDGQCQVRDRARELGVEE